MAGVVIKNLSKTFKGPEKRVIRAVNNLNLIVDDGELMVLLGPSGCGKTTTLRLIAGLEQPSEGSISIGGQDVTRLPAKDRVAAMVFQHAALYPHMTIYENLAFGLKLRKVPKAEIANRVRETAENMGVSDCLSRRPDELSGGQKQRAALARALVRRPKLLLLDEPLSNLDLQLRSQLRGVISSLHRTSGCTMIYVTHDQTEAMMLGTRLAVMNEGTIQQIGNPLEIYQRPRNLFVAGFVGWPPMNLVHGTIIGKPPAFIFEARSASMDRKLAFTLDPARSTGLAAFTGKEVVLGLRPENFGNGTAQGGAAFEAVIQSLEPAGADTYAHLACNGISFIARVSSKENLRLNQKREVSFEPGHARLFDAATGEAIPLLETNS